MTDALERGAKLWRPISFVNRERFPKLGLSGSVINSQSTRLGLVALITRLVSRESRQPTSTQRDPISW
jgi:hypothetical protein